MTKHLVAHPLRATNDARKTIMFVSTGLGIGGAEMMLFKLLAGIDRNRFDAIVVSLSDVGKIGERIEKLGFRVVALEIPPGSFSVRGLMALRTLIIREQPDIIQGWMYHGNLAAQLVSLLLLRCPPVLWSIRGTHANLSGKRLNTALTIWVGAGLSGRARVIINNSRISAAEHAKRLGYATKNVVVIPNGFDTDAYRPDETVRRRMRESLNLSEDTLAVGIVGRVDPIKDHPTFLRAARLVLDRFPNARFLLVGHGARASNDDLMKQIRECRLEGAVSLLGQRDDLPELTTALDLAVLSSLSEGFPNVLGEAMSCGVCVTSTIAGDSASIIGNTGALAPPRRPDLLSNAMSRILAMEPDQRRNLGLLARARIVENFSLPAIVRKYEEVFQGVLIGNRPMGV